MVSCMIHSVLWVLQAELLDVLLLPTTLVLRNSIMLVNDMQSFFFLFLDWALHTQHRLIIQLQLWVFRLQEAIENANEANVINKDPDSVFISGNSRPCLVDILMFGTLRQLKDLNSLNCLASPVTTNWFNTVNDIVDLVRFVVDYNTQCLLTRTSGFGIPLLSYSSSSLHLSWLLSFCQKKKWNHSNIKAFIYIIGDD